MNPPILPGTMSEAWKTQHTLLQRARNPNDEEAWREFVEFYDEFIRMILVQMNYQPSDFDDAIQDVLLKIWKSLPDFEFNPDRARFRTWLGRLIRNKVIDRIRSQKVYDQHLNQLKGEMSQDERQLLSESDLDQLIEAQWQRHLTKRAFENIEGLFSKTALKVFEMSLFGQSAKEISEVLDIAQDSVRVLKNRVQKRFVEEIQHLRSELEF